MLTDDIAAINAATEPDYEDFSMIPCVWCGMGPQIGGTGFCSVECAEGLYAAYSEEPPC